MDPVKINMTDTSKINPRCDKAKTQTLLRSTWLPMLLWLLTFALTELTKIDLWFQDFFYCQETGHWLVTFDKHSLAGQIFYVLPKILLGVFGAFLLLLLLFRKIGLRLLAWDRLNLLYVLVCMALVPSLVAGLKASTGVAYPRKIVRYGGVIPYRNVLRSIPRHAGEKRYKGWPAGHASGGFALFSLAFAASTAKGRRNGFLLATLAGWMMGSYQMLSGNHYLSHTAISMFLAWWLAALLAWYCQRLRLRFPVLAS